MFEMKADEKQEEIVYEYHAFRIKVPAGGAGGVQAAELYGELHET